VPHAPTPGGRGALGRRDPPDGPGRPERPATPGRGEPEDPETAFKIIIDF